MAEYDVYVDRLRKDKFLITVLIAPGKRKEFDIIITDKGLKITTDLDIRVSPQSSNSIIVDEVS